MDGRLTRPLRTTGRRLAFVVVIAVVALLHLVGGRELADRLAAFDPAAAMPARLQVAYVRVVEPEAPPVVAPVAAAPTPPRRARASARKVPLPASAASAVAALDESSRRAAEQSATEAAWQAAVARIDAAVAAANARAAREVAQAASESGVREAQRARDADAALDAAEGLASITGEGTPQPAAVPASGPTLAPFEWPASTRVSYVLTGSYRGDVSGQAQVEWVRTGDRYQVNYDFIVGPAFAPLISRQATSTGRIEAQGLAPERYDEETQVVFRDRRRSTIVFEPEIVVMPGGERRHRLAGVQDTASQFIQLTYLFTMHPERLRVGELIEFPLALPRSLDRYTYEVVGEETLHLPFGALQAFHLKPRRLAARKPSSLDVEIWFAPSLRYLPVRIRVEQDAANFVDMLIERKPEMAAS